MTFKDFWLQHERKITENAYREGKWGTPYEIAQAVHGLISPPQLSAVKKQPPIALFDLDGTLADYDLAMTRDLERLLAPSEQDSYELRQQPHVKRRIDLIRSRPGWWRELPKIEKGFQLLDLFRSFGFQINILTKGPYQSANSWTEKVDWCRQHVPDGCITITEDKGIVYGKVLCDDWPPYATKWLNWRPRGLVVMPDQPWNQDFEHPQVVRYTDNLDEVKDAVTRLLDG